MLVDNYWDDFIERVNETVDTLKVGKLPSLSRLTIHLTESCNFRCDYCNVCFTSKTMDKYLAFRITKEYSKLGGKTIHFTGGEPTIVSYFEELCEYAKSCGLSVSCNTNLYKKIDCTNINKLKTSFDTPYKDVYNKIVGVDSFDTVVANLKAYGDEMKAKGDIVSMTAVLDRNTYKSMLDLAKFVHSEFDVYNLYFSNYKGDNPDFAFTNEEIDDMFTNYIPKVKDFFREVGDEYSLKQLELYVPSDFIANPNRFEQNKTIPCYIQLSEMTIDVDGRCYNCSHTFRDGYKPFDVNVKEKSLGDAFKEVKSKLNGKYTLISKYCLSGCNCNLMGFNRKVHENI